MSSSKFWQLIIMIALLIGIAVLLTLKLTAPATPAQNTSNTTAATTPATNSTPDIAPSNQKTITIRPGNSLSGVFQSLGIQNVVLQQIMQLPLAKKYLSLILPGQKLAFTFDNTHLLQQLSTNIALAKNLQVDFVNNQWQAKIIALPLEEKTAYASGVIKTDLNNTAKKIGLPRSITAQLANIFSDQINFGRDLRPGNHFDLLYQKFFLNGKLVKTGKVTIAEFYTKKHNYIAIRYKDPKGAVGYYTPKGKNLKLQIMRYPIKFKRISSPFTYRRLDPILHVYRPHLGVDLAANEGTPIHAIGNGEIIFIGKKGGYGNAIVAKYGQHITVLCGHMEKFAKHLHRHSKIKMGQIIGYVGSTGWSTGPHVHFEVHVDGVPKNPVTLKLPDGKPVPHRYLKAFKAHAAELMAKLDNQ